MRPHVLAHADWSIKAAKRWIAFAELGDDGRYVAGAPEPAGDPATLLARLRKRTGATRAALVGFDFPIGVPATYAERVGITDFVPLLRLAGGGGREPLAQLAAVDGPSNIVSSSALTAATFRHLWG